MMKRMLAGLVLAAVLLAACSESNPGNESNEAPEVRETATTEPTADTGTTETPDGAEATSTPSPEPAPASPTAEATRSGADATPVVSGSGADACDAGLSPAILPGLTIEAAVESGGLSRTYRLYVPTGVGGEPAPLVFAFHGLGGSGLQFERGSGLTEVAVREGFVVVYPDGYGAPRSWRIRGTATIFPSVVNDVEFVQDLLARLQEQVCIDTSRVYATGHSNGAFFSSLLACDLPDVFAAIVPVAGLFYPPSGCDELVPTLAFHSTGDFVVPFAAGLIFGSWSYEGARASLAQWAETGGCSPIPYPSPFGTGASLEGYDGCENGAVASLVVIEGGDHGWPTAANGVSASEEAWAFFEQHSK